MARARNIKPAMYKNEDLAECSIWARYIFPGLWTLADREGRLEDRPKRIKAELLPFDTQDAEPLLRELAEKKDDKGVPFIVRYQNSDGRFIQISKFKEHQSPHYSEKPSVIKPPILQEKNGDIDEGNSGSDPPINDTILQENSGSDPPIKRGSQPPDSLILRFSDSPNHESLQRLAGNAPKNGARHPSTDDSPVVVTLPLRDGTAYDVRQQFVAELEPLYPAVDVPQTLREMRGWLLTHSERLKTRRGTPAFIGKWLQSEQEKHGG